MPVDEEDVAFMGYAIVQKRSKNTYLIWIDELEKAVLIHSRGFAEQSDLPVKDKGELVLLASYAAGRGW